MSVRKGALTYAVRMGMSAADGEQLSDLMPRLPADVRYRVLDQLWLRAVLTEQRRRTQIAERDAFDARADRILAALDPRDRRAVDDTHRCEDCGDTYYERMGSYWLADDELWQRVVGTDSIVLCPGCFADRARAEDIAVSWRAVVE